MANGFNIEILRRQAMQRSRQLAAVTGNPRRARQQLETELAAINRGFAGMGIESERLKFANTLAQRRLGLVERQIGLQESAFEEQQKGAGIQRLGQSLTGLAQLGLAGKELGLFGKGATAGQQLVTQAGVGMGGGIGATVGGGVTGQGLLAGTTPLTLPPTTAALGGGAAVPTATGVGATGVGATGLLSTVGGALAPAGLGFGVGSLSQQLIAGEGHRGGERFTAAGVGAAGGAAAGAAIGSIVPGVGTVIGGIIGGISGAVGGGCIIVTACHEKNSKEVKIAKEYRDKYLDKETLRGYYIIAESIVPRMKADEIYKQEIKENLVEPLLEYGKYILNGKEGEKPSVKSTTVTITFLDACKHLGGIINNFTRSSGEVI